MAEIRYTVGCTFPDSASVTRWLEWLRHGHVAAVMRGGATSAEVVAVDGTPHAMEVVYRFPNRAVYERYEREFAPALRVEGQQLFPSSSGIVYRRTVAEVVERFG
jgi:hypothetical protein